MVSTALRLPLMANWNISFYLIINITLLFCFRSWAEIQDESEEDWDGSKQRNVPISSPPPGATYVTRWNPIQVTATRTWWEVCPILKYWMRCRRIYHEEKSGLFIHDDTNLSEMEKSDFTDIYILRQRTNVKHSIFVLYNSQILCHCSQ